ncbi:trigger factor [Mycobacterium palustre]|uniref:Trigger factor n=1 Tax=Mycobacterium palustre TaxID=153971 RepID=A0A1X1Z218_9MYCO|nr:trigger factor [Mycobacterium palustre]MCV7103386.1 trigger factor [Mycobacterium palustre]ORW17393.1 trigger factor [Mycobacterium palustre]
MKSSVEQLSPTRVRINVEVPFTELEPDFQRAYKELAKQVRLPGFRPGKAPAKLLEARFGREAMLDQVVSEALPARYGQAVVESEVQPLGQPSIEVTKKEYGQELAFTAEVDVRPKLTLPDLGELKVTVDPVEVRDEDVDAELESLRARFASLEEVDRPVEQGDFLTIDLSATVGGEDVPNARAEGLSYEVGSGRLIAGLDDAVVGLSVDESKEFTAKMAAGEHAGEDAQVTVTVRSIKARKLEELNDEFAQMASEFDTIDELRSNLRDQVGQAKRAQQAQQIRDATIEALLERVEVPLPEAVVKAQVDGAVHNALHSFDHDEAKFAEALRAQGQSRQQFEVDAHNAAETEVKKQLLLDALADELDVQVGQDDLTERLVATSRQYGIEPQQLFGYLQENNQLPAMFADVRRSLAIAAAVRAATVTDSEGNTIDTSEFFGNRASEAEEADNRASEADDAEPVGEAEEADAADADATDKTDEAGGDAEPTES